MTPAVAQAEFVEFKSSPMPTAYLRPERRVRPRPEFDQSEVSAWIQRQLEARRPLVAPEGNGSPWYRRAKRFIDVFGSMVALALLGPIMLVTLVALTITTKGKPFYCQTRVGYLGRPFKFWKFRTMRPDADRIRHTIENEQNGPVFKNRRDPRITRIGRWLRKLSIDETPQLVSVLLGDMSLVGPRPPIPSEVVEYQPWQLRRLAVRPGLTCLWQVSGRSEIGFEDWVRMDLWYAVNQSLSTDMNLIVRTPLSVLSGRGAY